MSKKKQGRPDKSIATLHPQNLSIWNPSPVKVASGYVIFMTIYDKAPSGATTDLHIFLTQFWLEILAHGNFTARIFNIFWKNETKISFPWKNAYHPVKGYYLLIGFLIHSILFYFINNIYNPFMTLRSFWTILILFDVLMLWYHCLWNDSTSGQLDGDDYHCSVRNLEKVLPSVRLLPGFGSGKC